MDSTLLPRWTAADLRSAAPPVAATVTATATACSACHALVCPGWESLPVYFDQNRLAQVATLRAPDNDTPTVEEYHPDGTHSWSANAPIAPDWFPYNRCDVWRCTACTRYFLRYTEYGGYYVDERVREVQAALVVDAPAPG
jgi:hypothetical protein